MYGLAPPRPFIPSLIAAHVKKACVEGYEESDLDRTAGSYSRKVIGVSIRGLALGGPEDSSWSVFSIARCQLPLPMIQSKAKAMRSAGSEHFTPDCRHSR